MPNTVTKILPRKVHVLEGAQVPPLCVIQTRAQTRHCTIHYFRVDPETILECYTNSPTPLLESLKVKANQVRSMAASLTFHKKASMEQILRTGTCFCHNTFTDFYLKDLSLYSADLIQLGPVVAAEPILHPTGDH